MTYGTNPPDISKTAFECPHCGAYTSQRWYRVLADPLSDNGTPHVPDDDYPRRLREDKNMPAAFKADFLAWYEKMSSARPYFEELPKWTSVNLQIDNLFASECFVCKRLSVWVHDGVNFPPVRTGVPPHEDMPDDIRRDYDEARDIVSRSARGAAALLRLCVQKLCDELGEKGKKIDDAIGSLVAKGLDQVIQQALDTVRVIGNESVHPGQIDIRDNPISATQLFGLVNMIVDRMISQPKKVKALYDALPEGKRKAIDLRNVRSIGNQPKL